ncbi:MAG TPA: tetratricopeptide repeat protein [Chthonomonadales bacterium]|nr:tetratricopeptide repeat protein [Chthonomonadales bacterium]
MSTSDSGCPSSSSVERAPAVQEGESRRVPSRSLLLFGLLSTLLVVLAYRWIAPRIQEARLRAMSLRAMEEKASAARDDPAFLFHYGFRLIELGQPDRALPILKSAAGLDPANEALWAATGLCEWEDGHPETAISILENFHGRHPGANAANAVLQRIRTDRSASSMRAARRLLEARYGSPVGLLTADADWLLAHGRPGSALAAYSSLLLRWPKSARLYEGVGVSLTRLGRAPEALPCFLVAVKLDPTRVAAQRELALRLYQIGMLNEANPHFQAVVKRNPTDAESWYDLGECMAPIPSALRFAADALDHACKLQPYDARSWLALAQVQENRRREAEAEQCYRKALALAPGDLEVVSKAGSFLALNGHAAEGVALLKSALKSAPLNDYILCSLGRAALDGGKARLAAGYLALAAKHLSLADPVTLNLALAEAYRRLNNPIAAAAAQQQANVIRGRRAAIQLAEDQLVTRSKDPAAHLVLARLYRDAGQSLPALEQYQTVVELDSSNRAAAAEMKQLESTLKASGKSQDLQLFMAARNAAASGAALLASASK